MVWVSFVWSRSGSWKISLKTGRRLCTPCKSLPQIWDTFMHPGQNLPPKLRHIDAPRAEVCPESEAHLCTPGRSMTWIWGTSMHPGQKYALNLRRVYAPWAEVCPESEAHLCTLGIGLSQFWGKVLKGYKGSICFCRATISKCGTCILSTVILCAKKYPLIRPSFVLAAKLYYLTFFERNWFQ